MAATFTEASRSATSGRHLQALLGKRMSRQPSVEGLAGLGGGGVTDEHESGHEPRNGSAVPDPPVLAHQTRPIGRV